MSTTIDLQFQGRPGVIATAVDSRRRRSGAGGPGADARACRRSNADWRRSDHRLDDVRGAAADAHPSRSRRRGRHDRAASARPAGVRARHRRAASRQSGEAAGQRDAALRRRHGPAVGRVPGGAGRPSLRRAGRRRDAGRSTGGASRSRTPRATPCTTSATSIAATAPPMWATRPASGSSPGYVLPATPPPDIDLERWEESLQRIEAWQPARLYLTHFAEGERRRRTWRCTGASLARCARARAARRWPRATTTTRGSRPGSVAAGGGARRRMPEDAATAAEVGGAVPSAVAGAGPLLAEARGRGERGAALAQLANAIARSAKRGVGADAAAVAGSTRKRRA